MPLIHPLSHAHTRTHTHAHTHSLSLSHEYANFFQIEISTIKMRHQQNTPVHPFTSDTDTNTDIDT